MGKMFTQSLIPFMNKRLGDDVRNEAYKKVSKRQQNIAGGGLSHLWCLFPEH